MSGDVVISAMTNEHYRDFATMIGEYVEWCRERYAGDSRLVDAVFDQQSLDDELQELSSLYGAPNGRAFLARSGGERLGVSPTGGCPTRSVR